jgi:hypothetical protein
LSECGNFEENSIAIEAARLKLATSTSTGLAGADFATAFGLGLFFGNSFLAGFAAVELRVGGLSEVRRRSGA